MKSILKELGLLENKKENNVLNNLTKIPRKEPKSVQPHTMASKMFSVEQLDTLYLPNDNGYKYALVIVDIATRKCDGEPMKTRDAKTTVKTLEKIFKRGIIKRPKYLEVDDGQEFKGEFEKHFKKVLELIRKMTGRHRQQSVVEAKNHILGTVLNKRMLAEEINNDETSRNWVDIFPEVIKLVNKHFSHNAEITDPDKPIRTNKFSEDILENGTPVRIQLDNPIDYTDEKRLHGKFRAGDIRWSKDIGKITRFYLRPDQPVMYEVDNNNKVAYTKYQLQVISPNEIKPSTKGQRDFYAQKITNKKKEKGKVYYEVLWEDKTKTFEPRTTLIKQIPDMIKEYEVNVK